MKKQIAWTIGMVLIAVAALVPSEEVRATDRGPTNPLLSCSETGCNVDADCTNAPVTDPEGCNVCDTQTAVISAFCSQ